MRRKRRRKRRRRQTTRRSVDKFDIHLTKTNGTRLASNAILQTELLTNLRRSTAPVGKESKFRSGLAGLGIKNEPVTSSS